jgi:hypothetical protein
MSPVDDALDGIVLRWPKPELQTKNQRDRQRLDALAFAVWLVRLSVECLGWVAVVGLITQL